MPVRAPGAAHHARASLRRHVGRGGARGVDRADREGERSGGNGDLLVTVKVAVPPNVEGTAQEALEAYAAAERSSGFDPRAGWAGNR